MKLHRNDPCDM